MNLFLAFVVCFLSMVDVSLALSCYDCHDSTCRTTLPTATSITNGDTYCRIAVSRTETKVLVVRDSAGACTPTAAADFASGAAQTLVICSTADRGNNDVGFADISIGCYSCSDPTADACLNPVANSGTKVYDGTLKETGKGCSTVRTYNTAGKLTGLVRARNTFTDCASGDTITANGDGVRTFCCKDKDLCNDAVSETKIPVSTMNPTVPKHAPRNIINAFVLLSAVILVVVSK